MHFVDRDIIIIIIIIIINVLLDMFFVYEMSIMTYYKFVAKTRRKFSCVPSEIWKGKKKVKVKVLPITVH